MKKVYLATRGSYSDYYIMAIFSEESLCREYIDIVNRNEYNKLVSWDKQQTERAPEERGHLIHSFIRGRTYEEWVTSDGDAGRIEEYDLYDSVPALRWNEQFQWTEEVDSGKHA